MEMRGTVSILLCFFAVSLYHYRRSASSKWEGPPAFFIVQPQLTKVGVIDEKGVFTLHQYNDGVTLDAVNKMTSENCGYLTKESWSTNRLLESGEVVKFIRFEEGGCRFELSWLSARHRILLKIPLHPDRMGLSDWDDLPGIGPKLALSIENDRQKNGDFETLSALKRVKGIGTKKVEGWKEYFESEKQRN